MSNLWMLALVLMRYKLKNKNVTYGTSIQARGTFNRAYYTLVRKYSKALLNLIILHAILAQSCHLQSHWQMKTGIQP